MYVECSRAGRLEVHHKCIRSVEYPDRDHFDLKALVTALSSVPLRQACDEREDAPGAQSVEEVSS